MYIYQRDDYTHSDINISLWCNSHHPPSQFINTAALTANAQFISLASCYSHGSFSSPAVVGCVEVAEGK